jgi:hypothetical protein
VPEIIPARSYLVKYISSHPIPFIPFPSRGRGRLFLKRGKAPLQLPFNIVLLHFSIYSFKGEWRDISLYSTPKYFLKRGLPLSDPLQ